MKKNRSFTLFKRAWICLVLAVLAIITLGVSPAYAESLSHEYYTGTSEYVFTSESKEDASCRVHVTRSGTGKIIALSVTAPYVETELVPEFHVHQVQAPKANELLSSEHTFAQIEWSQPTKLWLRSSSYIDGVRTSLPIRQVYWIQTDIDSKGQITEIQEYTARYFLIIKTQIQKKACTNLKRTSA